jgi:mRNA interferase RelE/StbE
MSFTEQAAESISAGFGEIERGDIVHRSLPAVRSALDGLWNPKSVEEIPALFMPSTQRVRLMRAPPMPETQTRPPPWFIGWSRDFANSIEKIDRKLQGRILEALVEIAANPTELRGDTKKPLVGDMKGCWRYRIADYRIIYSPDSSTRNVTLLAFGARSSIYSD